MEIERTWLHGDKLIFKFQGIDSISSAEKLAGADVSIPADQRPPIPEGEYYQSSLIGCEVFDLAGRRIGLVEGCQETGGPLLLDVRSADGREILMPFARSIFHKIDIEAKRIEVDLPEGLEDLN